LKSKGLALIAVNNGDSAGQIGQYARENHFTFTIARGGEKGVVDRYGVQAFPTNYVLDATGRVVWRGVGFDEHEVRAALAKLGVK
jgi:hypothetical protein